MSSGMPRRDSDWRPAICSRMASWSGNIVSSASVRMAPGVMALTVMPSGPISRASVRVKPIMPREIKLGTATFDLERLELTRDGAPMRLTEAEGQLLKTLALHAHAPVERMDLSPDTADITGRAVDVQVTRLRRKLEADPKNPRYLQTVRGVGYMLAPD